MDVTMALLAALLWGGTDFLVGLNARAVGVERVASVMNLGGIAAILGSVFFKARLATVQVGGVVLVLLGAPVLHIAH